MGANIRFNRMNNMLTHAIKNDIKYDSKATKAGKLGKIQILFNLIFIRES